MPEPRRPEAVPHSPEFTDSADDEKGQCLPELPGLTVQNPVSVFAGALPFRSGCSVGNLGWNMVIPNEVLARRRLSGVSQLSWALDTPRLTGLPLAVSLVSGLISARAAR
jgi:hypothetical protein